MFKIPKNYKHTIKSQQQLKEINKLKQFFFNTKMLTFYSLNSTQSDLKQLLAKYKKMLNYKLVDAF